MKTFEQNKLELIFVVAEQCRSATSAFLSNQIHKHVFKFIISKIIHEETSLNFFVLLNMCAYITISIS